MTLADIFTAVKNLRKRKIEAATHESPMLENADPDVKRRSSKACFSFPVALQQDFVFCAEQDTPNMKDGPAPQTLPKFAKHWKV